MPLFKYAVILQPTVEEREKGAQDELVVEPSHFVAKDQRTAEIMAARKIPEELMKNLDRVVVAVGPF
ncbi:hypothetical protein AYO40_01110 [Planctomycetaceae bacterium SCGC AG-212-D15]|nr:hypothetical protein AYO40_01110 [Planctomycetaceae bacterium SCGC AG-212-D15]